MASPHFQESKSVPVTIKKRPQTLVVCALYTGDHFVCLGLHGSEIWTQHSPNVGMVCLCTMMSEALIGNASRAKATLVARRWNHLKDS